MRLPKKTQDCSNKDPTSTYAASAVYLPAHFIFLHALQSIIVEKLSNQTSPII